MSRNELLQPIALAFLPITVSNTWNLPDGNSLRRVRDWIWVQVTALGHRQAFAE